MGQSCLEINQYPDICSMHGLLSLKLRSVKGKVHTYVDVSLLHESDASMKHVRALPLTEVHALKTYSTIMLRASSLMLEINEFRCYEAKIEESEKGWQLPGVEPRTPLA